MRRAMVDSLSGTALDKRRGVEQRTHDPFTNHAPDWFVAIFTGFLVYVTYRLVTTTGDLRRSTDKLWEAGERQIAHLERAAESQSRDMQASIAEAKKSSDAAKLAADVAQEALLTTDRAWIEI